MFDVPKKKYVADEIGTEYKMWDRGERVGLVAPTGSGKTFFILNCLLPFAIANRRRILYIVNRKALRAQIEEDIAKINYGLLGGGYADVSAYITVTTYQHLERDIKKRMINLQRYNAEIQRRTQQINDIREKRDISVQNEWSMEILRLEKEIENIKKMRFVKNMYDSTDYFYIICDEAHYFLTDALFNTNTEISYNWVHERNRESVLILISATLENLLKMNTPEYNLTLQSKLHGLGYSYLTKLFSIPSDYRYIDVHAFDTMNDIVSEIGKKECTGKWLIFWNDIKQGEELAKTLSDNNIDAIFIDSSYGEDEETNASVEKITREKEMLHDVIIATATLDNGISIHDDNLQNIVIMADNKEEFIQMLGRKRVNTGKVNLYISRRSAGEFKRRRGLLERSMRAYNSCQELIGYPGIYGFEGYKKMQQAELAEKMLGNPQFYSEVRKFLYVTAQENIPFDMGTVYKISTLSIVSLANQIQFYNEQINRFDREGADAFLRTQLEWLNFSDIDECIIELKLSKEEKLRLQIDSILSEYIDKKLTKEQNLELRDKIAEILRSLLNVCIPENKQTAEMTRKQKSIIKNDRNLSEKEWNFYRENLNLPYKLEKTGQNEFVITRVMSENMN